MKTKKALVKRFKITRSGKILRRLSGQNHYQAKKSGARKRKGHKWVQLSAGEMKRIKKFLKV